MSHANLPVEMHYKLCKEAFNTATKLNNLIAVEVDGKVKTICKDAQNLGRGWISNNWQRWKAGDKGCTCIFVGYAENHDVGCCRMYNPETC